MDGITNPEVSQNGDDQDENVTDQQGLTNAENAGKATGTHQNNGYGNTPDEVEPADSDVTKSEGN
ncbi:hypothetical protein LT679_16355 [Mucilaginibacter roseus]|uniref:Uncharacterized protein n=1 Tax=Mucilaginibacter roseus TaxID=1528868 RepID=A0ABS8U7Q4_9SPHI|nr:hypothetical protein [Mucilaginibacter roseus]MCD8742185.1 hypothetical protein [Mucilaginibacter roseus]